MGGRYISIVKYYMESTLKERGNLKKFSHSKVGFQYERYSSVFFKKEMHPQIHDCCSYLILSHTIMVGTVLSIQVAYLFSNRSKFHI